jgi:heptosyltransferase-2
MIQYYLALAGYLGASQSDTTMELFTSPEDETAIDRLLSQWGLDSDRGILVLHPGGGFGPSKRWPPERFAHVADVLSERFNLAVAISAGPSEHDVAQAVQDSMNRPAVNLVPKNISIGQLKVLLRRSRLMISNDTGPRHFAVAFGVPVVTIFGSTDPAWTDTFFDGERIVRAQVDCGPCQKKTCKQDHRCMELVTPEMVLASAEELLNKRWK